MIKAISRMVHHLSFRWVQVLVLIIGMVALSSPMLAVEPAPVSTPPPLLPREGGCMNNLYTGTIDNILQVRLFLVRQGERLNGFYYYEKNGQYDPATNRYSYPQLQLQGKVEGNGQFVLTETALKDLKKAGNDKVTGRFTGAFNAQGEIKGNWETPDGRKKLPFLFKPTDRLEQGRHPRFRLRFEPVDVGQDQAEPSNISHLLLAIESEREVNLKDHADKKALACLLDEETNHTVDIPDPGQGESGGILKPDSVTVRLLEGQPNLYWIQYEIRDFNAPGQSHSVAEVKRSWVMRSGYMEQALFDEWSEGYFGYKWGFTSIVEDYALTYADTTLEVLKSRFESYSNEQEWPDEDGDESVTYSSYPSQTLRKIDVKTGQLIGVMWQKEFFSKGAASALVRDDGRSGWLIIRKNQLIPPKNESESVIATRRYYLPDLNKPGQVPAIAACWLYNRAKGHQVRQNQPYPSAPPERLRPDHFEPADCCAVTASPDGKSMTIYETNNQESLGWRVPVRLLAFYDGNTQACFSRNLAKEGDPWGKPLLGKLQLKKIPPAERTEAGETLLEQRITISPGAPLRPNPDFTSPPASRLPMGTALTVFQPSAATARIKDAEDHWYLVHTAQDTFGWVFGAQTLPFKTLPEKRDFLMSLGRQLSKLSGEEVKLVNLALAGMEKEWDALCHPEWDSSVQLDPEPLLKELDALTPRPDSVEAKAEQTSEAYLVRGRIRELLQRCACRKQSEQGPVAHWSFDTCNANDSGPFHNHGVIHGNPACIDGVRGKALRFDGINDYILVENDGSLNPTDQLTLVAWYRPTRSFAGNGNNAILDKAYLWHEKPHYQYHLGLNGNLYSPDRIPRAQGQFDAWVAVENEPVAINTGNDFWKPDQWYCLVSTYDQESLRFFVNGDPVGQVRYPGRLSAYPTPFTIAKNHNLNRGEIDYTPGDIDEIQIYNRTLSQQEVSQICGAVNASKNLAIGQPASATAQDPAKSIDCTTEYYTGMVGLLPVRAWLYRNGDKIDGFYAYEKSRRYDPQTNRDKYRLIKLTGSVDASDAVTLAEADSQAEVTGHWRGTWEKEKLSGEWRDAKGENPLAVSLQASTFYEDGDKPNFRLRFRPKLIEIDDLDPLTVNKKRCGYEILGVSFDGQSEIDLPRLVDSAVLGFPPDREKGDFDDFLSNVCLYINMSGDHQSGCGLGFSRWDGTPTLYGISYFDYGYEGYNHIMVPSGGTEKLLEFQGGIVLRRGPRVDASIDFEYRGSHLRVKQVETTSGHFCSVFYKLGEESLCGEQWAENVDDPEERDNRCLARYGERTPYWVEGAHTEMEEEYEILQIGQGYIAKLLPRETNDSHQEMLERGHSVVSLGEGERGWKIATDYLKRENDLLAYECVHRRNDGVTEAVKANCRLWNQEQLLAWRKPEHMSKRFPGTAGQEKSQVSLTEYVSCMSFLHTSDERSIAIHWTGPNEKPAYSNLIGYYDGERQICHSRFAAPGEKTRKPLDKGRYEALFNNRRKN